MRIYLAARYSRRNEMRAYEAILAAEGFDVQAEWITGKHDDTLEEDCARIDLAEVDAADVVISFTEPPGEVIGRGRGGRHVEYGYALAKGKVCFVVGYRENVFHFVDQIRFYPKFMDALVGLRGIRFINGVAV
jgi:nucleoside 2-deoxyribosyltransferase